MALTPKAAKSFNLPIVTQSMAITPADVQQILDVMIATGMQTGPLNGAAAGVVRLEKKWLFGHDRDQRRAE